MRLINVQSFEFEEFEGQSVPKYAILSHRWQKGEVLYADMAGSIKHGNSKPGWSKISRCCEQARQDKLSYVWIDTCCIDKSSSAELTEAINSMFKWYEESTICYAYLVDVHASTIDYAKMRQQETPDIHRHLFHTFLTEFYGSSWFTRGWTLQELLAPKHIEFFNKSWESLGSKVELCDPLTCVTCIPAEILLHQRELRTCTIAQRMSWASKRSTTRVEDLAYSLLGIFEVNMPLLYGERESAFVRLQEEILRRSNDESILLWQADDLSLLARSPSAFAIHLPEISDRDKYAAKISAKRPLYVELRCRFRKERQPCTLTNVGLSITLLLVPWYIDIYLVKLQVEKRIQTGHRIRSYDACVFLKQTVNDSRLARVQVDNEAIRWIESIGGKSLSTDFLQKTSTIPRPYVIAHDSWDMSAGEGYLQSWDVKKQRYGFKFNFQEHIHWGPTKTLEADDIICRRDTWNPQERTIVLETGGFEVLAIFRLQGAHRWRYMYFGFTPDFVPTLVQKDWHFETPFKSFNDYRITYPMRQNLTEALSYSHFWESIKRSDPEQELVIQGSQNPHEVIRAPTDADGLSLMITRWTSGYTFDFIRTEHKRSLTVPQKAADGAKTVTSNPTSASLDAVDWDHKLPSSWQPDDDAVHSDSDPITGTSNADDSVPSEQPQKEESSQDPTLFDGFEETQLFVVPVLQDSGDAGHEPDRRHVLDDIQPSFAFDVPKLFLNNREVDVIDE